MPAETHRSLAGLDDTRAPADAAQGVLEVVRDAISEVTGVEPDALTATTRLADAGVDGLVLLDVVELCEEELGERTVVALDDEDLAELQTVGDLVEVLTVALHGDDRS